MLTHPILEKLRQLNCHGMHAALEDQLQQADMSALSFDERLGLMIDREWWLRDNRRLKTRLQSANFKERACIEDIEYDPSRGLSRSVMQKLSTCQWVRNHENILLTGATGTGKSFIACALGHKACMEGFTARYIRLPKFLQDMTTARGDGQYAKLLKQLSKIDVLILDDWGISPLEDSDRRDLLEIFDDRHKSSSTIITSQLPLKHWHESIGNSTIADAILDRIVHNASKIDLPEKESMRKKLGLKEEPEVNPLDMEK